MTTDMTLSLTVWGNRMSPVFDSSATLLITKVCQNTVIKRTIVEYDPVNETQVARLFDRFRVDVLICGAITDEQIKRITKMGIRIIPFITGDIGSILDSYLQKPDLISDHLMPGTHPRPMLEL